MRQALTPFDVLLVVAVLAVFLWSLSMVAGPDAGASVALIEDVGGGPSLPDPSQATGGAGASTTAAGTAAAGALDGADGELGLLLATQVERGYPWELIVIHHTAAAQGTAASLETAGRVPHFVVGNGAGLEDGGIESTRLWGAQEPGTHADAVHVDRRAIGVSLVGDFTSEPPSAAQLDSALRLVAALCWRFEIPLAAVTVHRDVGALATACPGDAFPVETFRERLEDLLDR